MYPHIFALLVCCLGGDSIGLSIPNGMQGHGRERERIKRDVKMRVIGPESGVGDFRVTVQVRVRVKADNEG